MKRFLLLIANACLVATVSGEPTPSPKPSLVPGIKPIKNLKDIPVPKRGYWKEAPITATIQRYGGLNVSVFANEDVKNPSGASPNWYFAPLPIINRKELQQNLANLQKAAENDRPEQVHSLEFGLSFDNSELSGLIAEQINTKLRDQGQLTRKATAALVEPLPDEVIRICDATVGGQPQRIYCFPDPEVIEQGTSSRIQPASEATVSVVGTIKQLERFAAHPEVTERCVAGNWQGRLTFIGVSLREFANSKFRQQLTGKDKMKNEVSISTTTAGGGGGFHLGPVNIGGGASKSGTTTNVDVHRWVTRDHLLENTQSYLSDLAYGRWTEFGYDQKKDMGPTAEDMVNRILRRADKLTLRFDKVAEHALNYIDDQGHQLSVEVGEIDNIKLESNAQLDVTANQETKVKGNVAAIGGEVEKKDHLDLKIKNDSKASLKSPIIPTTVELFQVSDAVLDGAVQETSRGVDDASSNKDIPAVAAFVRDDAPINFDVGMIIASMIPYEKHSKEFRAAWVPCDGRRATGSKYADARIAALGESPGWMLPEQDMSLKIGPVSAGKKVPKKVERDGDVICVPDLRGQFLRGLNQFAGADGEVGGPRTDGREAPADPKDPAKPEGEKKPERTAGEWQEDALAKHVHLTPFSPKEPPWFHEGAEPRDRYYVYNATPDNKSATDTGWERLFEKGNKNNPRGKPLESETRPDNVAVYYYIKVN